MAKDYRNNNPRREEVSHSKVVENLKDARILYFPEKQPKVERDRIEPNKPNKSQK